MGVLGWTPDTLRCGASLQDLAEAYGAWRDYHGAAPPDVPAAAFMHEMLTRFPDKHHRPKEGETSWTAPATPKT